MTSPLDSQDFPQIATGGAQFQTAMACWIPIWCTMVNSSQPHGLFPTFPQDFPTIFPRDPGAEVPMAPVDLAEAQQELGAGLDDGSSISHQFHEWYKLTIPSHGWFMTQIVWIDLRCWG